MTNGMKMKDSAQNLQILAKVKVLHPAVSELSGLITNCVAGMIYHPLHLSSRA